MPKVAPPVDVNPWWTVERAADYLDCSTRALYRLAKNNHVRHVRLFTRRELRFRQEWLDAFLMSRATPEPKAIGAIRQRAS